MVSDLLFTDLPLATVRAIAVKWAQEMLKLPEFYIIDTETTGIDKKNDAFVQVALLHHPTMIMTNWEIDPERVISLGAARVHGKTNASRVGLPNFTKIYLGIAKRINGKPLVIYNAPFDMTMLQCQAVRYDLPEFTPSQVIDAMTYAALSYGMLTVKPDGRKFWRSPKLIKWAEMMQVFGIENAHDARSDVLFVYEAMKKLATAKWIQ